MPSSPSTRIRAELQAAGENLNTWGAPKLNSVVSRLEEAIDGRFAKTLTTDYTLVASNYVADEARMAFLDFSGSPTSPCTVTVPGVEKTYLVRNATAGDLKITTGSGNVVTLHTGTTSVIAVDATNVRTIGSNADDVATALASAKAYTDAATIGAGNLPSASGLSDYTLATGPTGGGTSGTPAWVSNVNMRLKLGLGSAAVQNTGTSGANVPMLDGANTWSGAQTFGVAPVFSDAGGTRTALGLGSAATQSTGTSGATVPLLNGANTWSGAQTFSAGITGTLTGSSTSCTGNAATATTASACSGNSATATALTSGDKAIIGKLTTTGDLVSGGAVTVSGTSGGFTGDGVTVNCNQSFATSGAIHSGGAVTVSGTTGGFTGDGTTITCNQSFYGAGDGSFATVTNRSDRRLKTDIQDAPETGGLIDRFRVTTFNMDGRQRVGVIAQEVEGFWPEAVTFDTKPFKDGEPLRGISISDVLFATLKEVQALRRRVERLER
jgi:hypothetical protein